MRFYFIMVTLLYGKIIVLHELILYILCMLYSHLMLLKCIFSNGSRAIYGFNFNAIVNVFSDKKKNTLICKNVLYFKFFTVLINIVRL